MASWTTRVGTPPGPLSLKARSATARWTAPMPATAPPSSSKPSRANSSISARASTPKTLTDRAVGSGTAAISSPGGALHGDRGGSRLLGGLRLLGGRRLRRAGRRAFASPESRHPFEPARQVPVPVAQQLHRSGQQDAADDRRVDQ